MKYKKILALLWVMLMINVLVIKVSATNGAETIYPTNSCLSENSAGCVTYARCYDWRFDFDKAMKMLSDAIIFDGDLSLASEEYNRGFIGNVDVFEGVVINYIEAPERLGYKFIGWKKLLAPNETVYDIIYSNYIFQAQYEPLLYTEEECLYGDLNFDNKVNILDLVTIKNMVAGTMEYHVSADLDGEGGTNSKDIITLIQILLNSVKTVNVHFDANGGTVDETTRNVISGMCIGELPVPVKNGFDFVGWYLGDSIEITKDIVARFENDMHLIAKWNPKNYTVSWNCDIGYTVTVDRTNSPYANAAIGELKSGDAIYFGDELTVSYLENEGYNITKEGLKIAVVTGDITAENIYAATEAKSVTYSIIYKSNNETVLGTSSATFKYGTINTIYPNSYSGYSAPSSQDVKWDSTSEKTIVFIYEIIKVLDSGKCGDNLNWELLSDGTLHISGTGAMYDYVKYHETKQSPWYKYRNEPYISEDGSMILNPPGSTTAQYLSTINYYADNPNGWHYNKIVIDEGVTYIGNWAFYRVCVEELTIPEGVESTGHFAIRYSPTLKKVNLPNSLKDLGDFGISRNQVLTTVNIGNGLERAGKAAFASNPSLTSLILPDTCVSINEQLNEKYGSIDYNNQGFISSASSLNFIDFGGVTKIPNRCCIDNVSLESVVIPNTVEIIEQYAFFKCTSLKNVMFEEGSKCKTIEVSSFRYAPIESFIGCTALETIGNLALGNNSWPSLKEFTFSNANKEFPNFVFSNSQLTTASIGPNVLTIPAYMFFKSKLETIYISNNVKTFSDRCLSECSLLTNIYYDGTKTQWDSITKGNYWAYNTPNNAVVHFSDGSSEIFKNCK